MRTALVCAYFAVASSDPLPLPTKKACADVIEQAQNCVAWAAAGECERNIPYMRDYCAMSCGHCDAGRGESAAKDGAQQACDADDPDCTPEILACVDENPNCNFWAESEECTKNPTFMSQGCKAACFTCQSRNCRDKNPQCPGWAAAGECSSNEDFMLLNCAFSCRSCFLDANSKCRRDDNESPAAVVGTIDATFERLIKQENVTVLHREVCAVAGEGAEGCRVHMQAAYRAAYRATYRVTSTASLRTPSASPRQAHTRPPHASA